MPTDTVFVIGCLAILGSRVPLSWLFLLSALNSYPRDPPGVDHLQLLATNEHLRLVCPGRLA
jgi:hypothetical protein